MVDNERFERMQRWADKAVDASAFLPEVLPESHLRERQAIWYADFYVGEDGRLIADPNNPAMREWLIDQEAMSPDLADDVLVKMRELAAAR